MAANAHQLAFFTPGMTPWSASFRKQIRQVPNLRYTARGRPHSMQRRTIRVENFGGRFAAAIFDLLAIWSSLSASPLQDAYAAASAPSSFFSGTPKPLSSSRAAASDLAVVTIVMFMPWGRVNLSGSISGNTICSESPRL